MFFWLGEVGGQWVFLPRTHFTRNPNGIVKSFAVEGAKFTMIGREAINLNKKVETLFKLHQFYDG